MDNEQAETVRRIHEIIAHLQDMKELDQLTEKQIGEATRRLFDVD